MYSIGSRACKIVEVLILLAVKISDYTTQYVGDCSLAAQICD